MASIQKVDSNTSVKNKQDNVCITWHGGTLVETLLKWKCKKCYIFWVRVCSLWCLIKQSSCAILSSLAYSAVQYFYTLSHKRHDFRKKDVINIKSLFQFSLQLLSETLLILTRTERGIVINVHKSSCKLRVILVRFYCRLTVGDRFRRKMQMPNLIKISCWRQI
jgi:hypothetical protein